MSLHEREVRIRREDPDREHGHPTEDTHMAGHAHETGEVVTERSVVSVPSRGEVARRIILLFFGLTQLLLTFRIVLLLLDAREAHPLVASILDVSQVFVEPFEGVLRTNALQADGSILDIAAIVALVGWTAVEAMALAIAGVFRREPYSAA